MSKSFNSSNSFRENIFKEFSKNRPEFDVFSPDSGGKYKIKMEKSSKCYFNFSIKNYYIDEEPERHWSTIEFDAFNNKKELLNDGTTLFETVIEIFTEHFGEKNLMITLEGLLIKKIDFSKIPKISKINIIDTYIEKIINKDEVQKNILEATYRQVIDENNGARITFEDNFFKICNDFETCILNLDKCCYNKIGEFFKNVRTPTKIVGKMMMPTIFKNEKGYSIIEDENLNGGNNFIDIDIYFRIKYVHGIYDEDKDIIIGIDDLDEDFDKINKIFVSNSCDLNEDIELF